MSLILYELEVTIIMFFLFFIDNVFFLIFSFIPRLMMLSLCFQIDNFAGLPPSGAARCDSGSAVGRVQESWSGCCSEGIRGTHPARPPTLGGYL